jgi:hypothetical protein
MYSKVVPVHAMKADGGIGSTTPLILISALVYFMLLLHYIRERHPAVSVIDGVGTRAGRGVLQKRKFSWP